MEKGTCPVCNGTTRKPCPDNLREYGQKNGWYGYDKADNTVTCDNCGGQTMYGKPTGVTYLRKDGTPCKHEYKSEKRGNCYYKYTCIHCGYAYDIDSGD